MAYDSSHYSPAVVFHLAYIHSLFFAERVDPEERKQPHSDFQVKLLPCVNHQCVQPEAFQDRIKVYDGVLQH